MNTLGTRVGVALAANAVALVAAAALLDRVSIRTAWFPLLVVVFSLVGLLVGPLVGAVVRDRAPALASGAGLIATLLTLVVTDLVSDSIQIEGLLTWVLATLIVWAAVLAVQYVAPRLTAGRRRR